MTEKNPLTEKLRPHVGAIKAAVDTGDKMAERIVNLYELCRACPADRTAPVLCEAAFDEWVAKRG